MHDELIAEANENCAEQVAKIIAEEMEHAADLRVRASETLPVSAGFLLDPATVEITVTNGAAVLVLPPPDPATQFYRVEIP